VLCSRNDHRSNLAISLVRAPGSKEAVGFSEMLDKGCPVSVEISKGLIAAWGVGVIPAFVFVYFIASYRFYLKRA
jgi:hypothetical protein